MQVFYIKRQADQYTVMKMFLKPGTVFFKKKGGKNILLNLWLCCVSTMKFKSYDMGKGTLSINSTLMIYVLLRSRFRISKDAKKITAYVQQIGICSKIKV